MIACPQPLNAWHITSGRLGQALCGLVGEDLLFVPAKKSRGK